MAEFKAQSTKDTQNLNADTLLGSQDNIGVDTKKGILTVSVGSSVSDGVIDTRGEEASLTSIYKTVTISGDYTDQVDVYGNPNVADVIYAGGGGGIMDGGTAYTNDKSKLISSADKFYGGDGADTYIYSANGGKDNIFNYGNGDVIQINGWTETQSLSFVDKNGGLTLTINDDADTLAEGGKAGTTAKNSVLTIDGTKTKTADASYGFHIAFADDEGNVTSSSVYGAMTNYGYGQKNNKEDATTLTIGSGASGTVDVSWISSTVKNIDATKATKALYIKGNANGSNISIGSAGGTLEGGYDTAKGKAVADNLYGTSSKAVTFIANGGKDVIYNYKTGDNIVYDTTLIDEDKYAVKASGSDITYTLNKDTSFTIKNYLGQAVQINGEIDEANSHTLPTGLVYDAKLSKVSADASKIKVKVELVYNDDGTPKIVVDSDGNMTAAIETLPPDAIYIGGANEDGTEVPFESTVTMIDLATSSAPVIVDTSDEYGDKVTAITVGKSGSTVTGNNNAVQAFTGGAGDDLFIIDSTKILSAEDPSKAKPDTIANLSTADSNDTISIVGATADNLSFVEKGKDLNVYIGDGEGASYNVLTIKNFDSDTGATILGDEDDSGEAFQKVYGAPAMQTGVSYVYKNNKIDRTGIVAGVAFKDTVLAAVDYGDAALKTIDATSASSSKLSIVGSSAANVIYAPTAKKVATTLDGGTGNDNLYGASVIGGQTTYVFQPQIKGKKDVITNFNEGDVIVIDQSIFTSEDAADSVASLAAEFKLDEDEKAVMHYVSAVKNDEPVYTDSFNDTKADVVISVNKSNSITIKNAAGKRFIIQDGIGGDEYEFGHKPPTGLAYDAKNTAVTLASDAGYEGDVNLSDYATYYNTIKKVDLSGNTLAAGIYGNSIANEFIAGAAGSTLDGGAIEVDADGAPIDSKQKPTADKMTGGAGVDYFVYDAGYGKDTFSVVGSADIVSLGSAFGQISKSDLSITDKGTVLTVVISGEAIQTDTKTYKTAINTTANSTFTISKEDSLSSVHFTFAAGGDDFTYGYLPAGASYDDPKKMSAINVDSAAAVMVDASVINSQPKTIDARSSAGAVTLVGNANADAIYAGSGGSVLFGGTAGAKAVKDNLYGGDGTDYFVFDTQGGVKGKEQDIISNYKAGDVIVLSEAPTSVKADGKAITLTFNDTYHDEAKDKDVAVASTLVINGEAQDSTMKKFNAIDSTVEVTFAIGEIYDEETGELNISGALSNTMSYAFDPTATAEVTQTNGTTKSVALKSGIPWDQLDEALNPSSDSEQFAAVDGWLNDVVSTDNAVVSELDSILKVNAVTDGGISALEGDAYFTNTGFDTKAAALASARHQSKK